MNDSPQSDVVIFAEAIQLSTGERAAYLERACGADREQYRRVERLLKTHDQAGDFLEQPAPEAAPAAGSEASFGEKPGDRIGRYKLLQQIGEGGCGVVYMAEQAEPVRRRVALKIIKAGMDTKSVMARFEAERQALALMDHPSIAKVFDAGATESGRPYFVMELVRGVKITDYCDGKSLSTVERLRLFVQVCRAVQHAHQKGIIHRDIKPSNILVTTTEGGSASPVMIDFGIAKATTNQTLTDKTLFTAFEMLIGTPAYMSPEQADLSGVDVDTRTDVYSLGVLLYELLTGSPPLDSGSLMKAGLDEVRRIIRERDPDQPSMRLRTMAAAELTTTALHRQAAPPALIRSVRGDLDWIVMKALEKDRRRRYETANGLALDVERYLVNEPISARPPSRFYKLQKTALRNRLLFAGIGVIALLLVVSLIVVSASLARERRSRREAEAASVKSQQVTQFLKDMLNGVGPSVALGRDTTMLREILDETAERIGKGMSNQPAVEAEMRNLIGRLYREVGKFDRAEEMHRAALAIHRKIFGPKSAEAATSLNDLGMALIAKNKLPEAETVEREALAIRRQLYGHENAHVATSLNDLSSVYRESGRLAEAEPMALEALGIREKLFGKEQLEVADSLRNLSIILGDEGKWAESEAMSREVLAIRRKLLGPEHPWLAYSLDDIAWAAGARGNLDEAEALERESLAMRRRLLGNEHPDVAKSLYLIGDRLRQKGNLKDGHASLSEALAIQRKVLDKDNSELFDTMRSLGLTLEAEGNLADAEQMHREALVGWRTRGEQESWLALSEVTSLTGVLMAEKKFSDAEKLLGEVLTPAFVKQPSSIDFLTLMVKLKANRSQWQEAAADAALAVELQPSNETRFSTLAALLVKAHDRPAYEQFRQKILANFSTTTNLYVADQVAKASLLLPPSAADLPVIARLADIPVTEGTNDTGAVPFFQLCKTLSEYRQGHFTAAAEWAQKSIDSPRIDAHGHAYALLAMADWQLGKKDEARAALAEGEALAPEIMPQNVAEDTGNGWLAWLYARIQLDEATALVGSPVAQGR